MNAHTHDQRDQAVFRALSDPSRRQILDLLREAPRTTGELGEAFSFSRFAVMKHLKVLEEAELVLVRRKGRERWNHLNAVPLQHVHERWLRPFEAEWARRWFDLERVVTRAPAGTPDGRQEGETPMPQNVPNGELRFVHIEQQYTFDAPRERVFDALLGDIGAWWGRPYIQDVERVTRVHIEPRVGGLFTETWSDDEGALWGTVTNLKTNERIVINGTMAMAGPVTGIMRFELEDAGAGKTTLRFSHRAMGEIDANTEKNYGMGWTDLLGRRLSAWVEREEKMGLGHEPPMEMPSTDSREA